MLEAVPRGSRALYDLYTVYPKIFFCGVVFFPTQEGANQVVPEALMDMAMKACKPFHYLWIFLLQELLFIKTNALSHSHSQNAWFRKSRFRHGKGKASGREGRPRMRERPGLGMHALTVNVCFC